MKIVAASALFLFGLAACAGPGAVSPSGGLMYQVPESPSVVYLAEGSQDINVDVPGMGAMNVPKDALKKQEGQMKIWKFAMNSMTPKEREDPTIIDGSRVERIAKGSGRTVQEVRGLIKQYNQMKKAMKMFGSPKKMQKLMKKLGGNLPMNI